MQAEGTSRTAATPSAVRWGQLAAGIVVAAVGLVNLLRADERKGQRSALVVAFIGVWLLLVNLEVFGFNHGDSWPLALVAVGLASLLRPDAGEGALSGLGLIGLGAVFLAITQSWLGLSWSNGWPLLVILAGLAMVTRSLGLRGPRRRPRDGT
jgi:hypothetical protein